MFRVTISVLLASTTANRVHTHEFQASTFGATCTDLQAKFHHRVGAFQAAFDAIENQESTGKIAQVRLMMKVYGMVRTMRRARTCQWVLENDSEDIEQVRGIVQGLLAENPCCEAARAELEAGQSAENAQIDLQVVQHAMSILSSDTCDVGEQTGETINLDDDGALNAYMKDAEDNVQDVIEEMEDQKGEGAFIQTRVFRRNFFKTLGVVLLTLFFVLACLSTFAVITAVLGSVLFFLYEGVFGCNQGIGCHIRHSIAPVVGAVYGAATGTVLGLTQCFTDTYSRFLSK